MNAICQRVCVQKEHSTQSVSHYTFTTNYFCGPRSCKDFHSPVNKQLVLLHISATYSLIQFISDQHCCVRLFNYFYHKLPEKDNLKEERFIQLTFAQFHSYEPEMVWCSVMVADKYCFSHDSQGCRETEKGQGKDTAFSDMPPVSFLQLGPTSSQLSWYKLISGFSGLAH